MAVAYSRGSEWRRWDLHIHAPGTAMEDQFGDWEEYVLAIEAADSSIAAVGITDYATIRTYKTFLEHRKRGRMKNIALALPNIEFRISPETKRGKGINLHLLVCSDEADHVSRIEEALSRLSLKRAADNIPCTEQGLTRLGKLTKPNLAHEDEAAFLEGTRQFKVEFDQFRSWYEGEQWLYRNSLVGLASGSSDGASGLTDSGFLATRRELYAFTHLIFSGTPGERESWLGRGGIAANESRILRMPKPVVHGSDAHSLNKLFRPELNRFCWIKADPTFEGLRQILYEPEDRVWIGESQPTTHESRSVLNSISISNANGWFDERTLPLNPGLVAIIGLKGSGKTALADLIALAGGSELDPEESFVSRARDHIDGLGVTLNWGDGSTSSATLPSIAGTESSLGVKYLSQRFVERLCSGDTLSEELHREVESVIFEYLEPEDRMDAENFSQLRAIRTAGVSQERTILRGLVTTCSHGIATLDQRWSDIQRKAKRRAEIPILLAGLRKAMPKIDDRAIAAKLEELNKLRERKNKVSRSIADLKATRQEVEHLERSLAAQVKQFASFWTDLEKSLRKLGFTEKALASLSPTLPLNLAKSHLSISASTVFLTKYAELDEQIKKLEGQVPPTSSDGGLSSKVMLDADIKKLESELKLDDAKKSRILEIQQQERVLSEEQRKIEKDFKWVGKGYHDERQALQDRRLNSYLGYFELLEEERRVLQELYAPLKESLSSQGAHERKLDMVCRVDVNVEAWIARGLELFDLRKSGTFKFDSIQEIVTTELLRAWKACDSARIGIAINKCVEAMKAVENLRGCLKTGYQPIDVAEWLFSVGHIEVSHGIQYEGKDLRSLSPGTKGIVLIILYLAVDRSDTRPLIVDQPDENLDNQSTFEVLRKYFRETKKRRQIIIITHNPNLVVNTDAEQIIVARSEVRANGLPHIFYSLGGIEALRADGNLDCSIREAVCRILEGGREAFRMREQRYGEASSG